ncbi:GATA zinc finger domain-containing protein 14-like isoform X2 [Agrilus planipennis]|uniref:GATA zinc finger domain-containing protein 14-like isoform X2 n=1 Tax=Agrilus planipennis TaxID=224129 RepID=A0A1W4XUQ8_AGRPL|nr:GATA zinc finger domain-containing protein 14-like isoform X2 [Agrilus planipennis]
MAELDSKPSVFLRSWLCCFASRPKRTEFCFVKPASNLKEEEYDYVVEKLSVKKVPVSLFEDYQHENSRNNVRYFPSRSSSDYEDTSEKCLAIYNLNDNSNDSRPSDMQNEDNVSIKRETPSSHSTFKKVSSEYLKKCNVISIVKSKLKKAKRNTWEVSTSSNLFEEVDYKENLHDSLNTNTSHDISMHNSNKHLKTDKKEKMHLKMDTFGCHYYIEQDKTALIEQKNNLQASCLIQKTSISKMKCDQNTQTCVQYVAVLQDQIKVTASTNTENSHTAINKSALTNGTLEPIKINLTLSTVKNNERNSQSKQLDKECQTENNNKSSILRLKDIINANDSLADINKKYSYKNRVNEQATKYTNKIPINVHYSQNDIPEKESRSGLLETCQENSNTFFTQNYSELNPVGLVVPSTNFFKENHINNNLNNSRCYYLQNNKKKPPFNSSTLNTDKKCPEDDQAFNCFPERDIKSSNSSQSIERSMTFNFQMGLLQNVEDLHNAEDNSTKERNGERDKTYSNTELPESDSQFTQSITLTENNSESSKHVPPSSRNIQEIRNVNISSNNPFCSAGHNKNLKNAFLRHEQTGSPRLTEVQRIAQLTSSEKNPVKWKIVIKQRKGNHLKH